MDGLLFDCEIAEAKKCTETCRKCVNRERWKCNSKVISYCTAQRSGRTFNGFKKIKATNTACELYKEETDEKQ